MLAIQSQLEIDTMWMQQALAQAQLAATNGEVPVGAVLVHDNECIASGYNCPIGSCDPTAHAEIIVLRRAAAKLKNYRLLNCTLYVTIEPCLMCVGAITHARLQRLVYAAPEPKAGAVISAMQCLNANMLNHQIEVSSGILSQPAQALIQAFFQVRRL